MRVVGIDPGSRFLGYGVVEAARGRVRHVGHGVVRADPTASLAQRLAQIFSELSQVVALYRPEAMAVEGVFTHRNVRSALVLGHARGVVLLVAARSGLTVHEYAPAAVKRSVGAAGNGAKESVARLVSLLLQVERPDRLDASDALAVAICHAGRVRSPLRSASYGGPGAAGVPLAERLSPGVVRFGARR